MNNRFIKLLILLFLSFSSLSYACGDNPNAIIQGPFKDDSFQNGSICFQITPDKRDINFFLNYTEGGEIHNVLVDTFYYSDAPVELMSVFFAPVNTKRHVVVLLRWNVNYLNNDLEYQYYYEVKAYEKVKGKGYVNNLNANIDSTLSGYQVKRNGKVARYLLDDADKIKKYLKEKYIK